jgi:hypothetical protein
MKIKMPKWSYTQRLDKHFIVEKIAIPLFVSLLSQWVAIYLFHWMR